MPGLVDNNTTIAKNTIFLSLRMIFVMLISFYTSRIILRTLGVDDYGIYNVVCGFVSMFAFLNTSMNNGIQRFYNYEYGVEGCIGARKVYNVAIRIQVILAIVTVILVESIGLWYIENKMVIPSDRLDSALWVFEFSVLSLVILILQIPYSAAIIANEKLDYYAIVSIIDAILKLLIVLILPLIPEDKLVVYGALMLMISICNFLLYYFYAKQSFEELSYEKTHSSILFKEMLSFSGWNLFGSSAQIVKEQGINMILNLFFGPVVNAARAVAYQVTGAMQSFIVNITSAARPQLTQSYAQGNIDRSKNIVYSISKISYYSVLFLSIPVLINLSFILNVWLGDSVPDHSDSFIAIVALVSLVNSLNPPISFLVHATGKMRRYQVVTSVFTLLIIPIAYLMLKNGSTPESVFWLLLVVQVIIQFISLIIVNTLVDFPIDRYLIKVVYPIVLVSVLSFAIPYMISPIIKEGWWRLLVTSFISFIWTGLICYSIGLSKNEKSIVNCYILGILRKRNKIC